MPSVSQVVSTLCPLIRMKLEEPFFLSWFISPPFFFFSFSLLIWKKHLRISVNLLGNRYPVFSFFFFLTDGYSEGSSCYEILCFGGLVVHSSLPHFIHLNLIWGRCYMWKSLCWPPISFLTVTLTLLSHWVWILAAHAGSISPPSSFASLPVSVAWACVRNLPVPFSQCCTFGMGSSPKGSGALECAPGRVGSVCW